MKKTSNASTNYSSGTESDAPTNKSYPYTVFNNNNKLPDNDSLISYDEELDGPEPRDATYLLSFERPLLEWSSEFKSSYLTLAPGGNDDDFMQGGRLCISETSLHSFKSAFANEPFYPGNRYFF